MDTIRRRNPRIQGEIGLGDAIGWFATNGYRVCIPLADNQPYDLVVERRDAPGLRKIQVKTTTCLSPYGRYVATLETAGGNQSAYLRKAFDPSLVDLVFILTDADERYLIPADRITAKRSISLGHKWQQYRVDQPRLFELPTHAE